jgi:hypothetical protein
MEQLRLRTRMHKAKAMPKEGFQSEVERYLKGKETEARGIIYSRFTRVSPVVEKALDSGPYARNR